MTPPPKLDVAVPPPSLRLIAMTGFEGYALIDSGNGRKLERFGGIVVDRPEPQALWQPSRPDAWKTAHAVFAAEDEDEKGRWKQLKPVPETWDVPVEGITVKARLMAFRHLGLFPEQLPHWQWMRQGLAAIKGETPRVLNLFGYTGAASLLAAAAGAEVVHVDASKKAIGWARENQAASKLDKAVIRWIAEDARKFVAREVRRGRTYHCILVDPPKYGRGTDGEIWELFADLPAFMRDCEKLLAPQQSSMVLTAYAIRASALAFDGLMRDVMANRGGTIESGELAILEETGRRALGTSLYARWSAA